MFSPLLIKIGFATLSSFSVAVGGYFIYKKASSKTAETTVASETPAAAETVGAAANAAASSGVANSVQVAGQISFPSFLFK